MDRQYEDGAGYAGFALVAGVRRGPAKIEVGFRVAAYEFPTISPDATMVAYAHGGHLWIRDLDHETPRQIEDAEGVYFVFWAPQSDYVGYLVEDTMPMIPVVGNWVKEFR